MQVFLARGPRVEVAAEALRLPVALATSLAPRLHGCRAKLVLAVSARLNLVAPQLAELLAKERVALGAFRLPLFE